MPASDPTTLRSSTLANGLRVVLCSAPRLKRCAAALRVAAGSHDVAPQWPGLAHFLEHLFFLGTERFPADQNLMAFVQRHGGQVNASTRERTTDFFFELAPAVFAQGLERLCEMLAHPRMSMADQLREREVLHAEFIAWSRDDASRAEIKRLQALSARHPMRGFHAGNRYSLPVPRPSFQRALQHFYRTFYQAGQMTLSLAGPQTLDELQALATTFGGYFATGRHVEQLSPPALVEKPAEAQWNDDQSRINLMFACEELPSEHEHASAFLCTWINNAQPGGLVSQLRDQGLIESLKADVLYEFGGQVLLDVQIALKEAADARLPAITSGQTTHIQRQIFDWLTFFKTHYRSLLTDYALLEQRRLDVSSALQLARHYSAWSGEPGLSDQAIRALVALLAALTSHALFQPHAEVLAQTSPDTVWRLPEPNPFLRPIQKPTEQLSPLPSLVFNDDLPATGEGVFYLRWTLEASQPKLAHMLNESLHTLSADARQAGVTLTFTTYGNHWQLKLAGLIEPLPLVLEHALRLLGQPDPQTLSRFGQPHREPAPIPIRQLLKTLPDHYLNSTSAPETNNLQRVWAHSRWLGFGIGLEDSLQNALIQALQQAPGEPDSQPGQALAPPTAPITAARWQVETSESSENAVLLFWPTPSAGIEDEAAWRLFAHIVQAPFYQRLRVDMQLGYAVFSGFRQIAGQGGLLFGVQSPNVNAAQLVDHINTFLLTLPTLIENADLPAQRAILYSQLDPALMDTQQAAEMLWQAHQAGHGAHYPVRLQHSIAQLPLKHLLDAASRTALPDSTILVLSNRPSPGGSAPVAK
jgi:coenzyme PQQ biosynthesis probable peptidase PqqF